MINCRGLSLACRCFRVLSISVLSGCVVSNNSFFVTLFSMMVETQALSADTSFVKGANFVPNKRLIASKDNSFAWAELALAFPGGGTVGWRALKEEECAGKGGIVLAGVGVSNNFRVCSSRATFETCSVPGVNGGLRISFLS